MVRRPGYAGRNASRRGISVDASDAAPPHGADAPVANKGRTPAEERALSLRQTVRPWALGRLGLQLMVTERAAEAVYFAVARYFV